MSQPSASTSVAFLKRELQEREEKAKKMKISSTSQMLTDEMLGKMTERYKENIIKKQPHIGVLDQSLNQIIPLDILGMITEYEENPISRCNILCNQVKDSDIELPIGCKCLATFFHNLLKNNIRIYYKKEKEIKETKINELIIKEGQYYDVNDYIRYKNDIRISLRYNKYYIEKNSRFYDRQRYTIQRSEYDGILENAFKDVMDTIPYNNNKRTFQFHKINKIQIAIDIPLISHVTRANINNIIIDFGHPLCNMIMKKFHIQSNDIGPDGEVKYQNLLFSLLEISDLTESKNNNNLEIKTLVPFVESSKKGGNHLGLLTKMKKIKITF